MTRRRWAFVGLTVVALLSLGVFGASMYDAGFAQGALDGGGRDLAETGFREGALIGFGVVSVFFKVLFAFLFFALVAKLFAFRRFAHAGAGGRWGDREEMRSRMEARLTEWHEKAHDPSGDGSAD